MFHSILKFPFFPFSFLSNIQHYSSKFCLKQVYFISNLFCFSSQNLFCKNKVFNEWKIWKFCFEQVYLIFNQNLFCRIEVLMNEKNVKEKDVWMICYCFMRKYYFSMSRNCGLIDSEKYVRIASQSQQTILASAITSVVRTSL